MSKRVRFHVCVDVQDLLRGRTTSLSKNPRLLRAMRKWPTCALSRGCRRISSGDENLHPVSSNEARVRTGKSRRGKRFGPRARSLRRGSQPRSTAATSVALPPQPLTMTVSPEVTATLGKPKARLVKRLLKEETRILRIKRQLISKGVDRRAPGLVKLDDRLRQIFGLVPDRKREELPKSHPMYVRVQRILPEFKVVRGGPTVAPKGYRPVPTPVSERVRCPLCSTMVVDLLGTHPKRCSSALRGSPSDKCKQIQRALAGGNTRAYSSGPPPRGKRR